MGLLDDLKSKIAAYEKEKFVTDETASFPDTDNSKLTFGNTGLTGEFAFLFVDIRKSSEIVGTYGLENAAKIYQSFHDINVRVIKDNGGVVRAFDGDRVMGVFGGNSKNTSAAKAAMQIIWAVRNILNPTFKSTITCGAGIDYGNILITKVGVGRDSNNNDLVWVGNASGYAAHLANKANNGIIISTETYGRLHDSSKLSSGVDMWTAKNITLKSGKTISCYETGYEWKII